MEDARWFKATVNSTGEGYWYYPMYSSAGDTAGYPGSVINIPSVWIDYNYNGSNKKNKSEVKGMRSLFKVYVVDPRKAGKLLDEKTVIAETEEQALLKAGVASVASDAGLELEQVDTYVEQVAQFIRPRKETQKVKVVAPDEDD